MQRFYSCKYMQNIFTCLFSPEINFKPMQLTLVLKKLALSPGQWIQVKNERFTQFWKNFTELSNLKKDINCFLCLA